TPGRARPRRATPGHAGPRRATPGRAGPRRARRVVRAEREARGEVFTPCCVRPQLQHFLLWRWQRPQRGPGGLSGLGILLRQTRKILVPAPERREVCRIFMHGVRARPPRTPLLADGPDRAALDEAARDDRGRVVRLDLEIRAQQRE